MKRPMVLLALLLASSVATAQAPRRVPLTGYVDRKGHVIEPAIWDSGSIPFQGDWITISRKGKSGYLNLRTHATTGLIFDAVTDAGYDHALFSFGPEPFKIGDKWGYVDQAGLIVIPPRFANAQSYDADGFAIVQVVGPMSTPLLSGMIDRSGKIVVVPRYERIWSFHGTQLATVGNSGSFGVINRMGQEVIPLRFGAIGVFAANGLAPASTMGSYGLEGYPWGYIDLTGHFVIPERFVFADNFSVHQIDGGISAPLGLARVELASQESAYIDASGTIVTRFPPGVTASGMSPNGLVRFQDMSTARYGFADAKTGSIVIPARFAQVGGFSEHGLAAATETGKAGYIHADGQWAFPPRFTSTSDFDALGQAQVSEDGRSELIDGQGNVLATLTHGENFYHQDSDFAAFRVFPGREDSPAKKFGRWSLDATLYAIPETPSFIPSPTGDIRLTFATDDGLVRWRIETEGWVITVRNEEGPIAGPDIARQDRLAELPGEPDALTALLIRQVSGQTQSSMSIVPPGITAQAAQSERASRIAANQSRYIAQLRDSSPDFARALAAMRARISEQFGKLSGAPCMPPQCIY